MIHFQFLGPGAHGYLVKTFHVSSILSIQTPYKAGYSSLAGQVLLLFVWWVIWNGRWQKEQWWGLSSTLETALKSKSPAGQHFLVSQASLHRTLMSTFPALQANYCCLVAQSRLALATSWAVARQALSVGFPRWEQWSEMTWLWLLFSSPFLSFHLPMTAKWSFTVNLHFLYNDFFSFFSLFFSSPRHKR